jgi:2-methylcitrate dehydratase PrpD
VSETVDVPRGDPHNPLTEREIKEKFVHLVHTENKQEMELLKDLETLEDVNVINRLFHSW